MRKGETDTKEYIYKDYALGIKADKSCLDNKYKMRSSRYKGKGRPRKSDYDYKTMREIIEESQTGFYDNVQNIFNKGMEE